MQENRTHPNLLQLQEDVTTNSGRHPHFIFHNGILFSKRKPFLGNNSSLKSTLLQEFHTTPTSCHVGVAKTLTRLKDNVYWEAERCS